MKKSHELVACPQCGAVYRGTLAMDRATGRSARGTLPACHRVNDEFLAERLTLMGRFVTQHRDEILQIVRRQEAIETTENPLNRIMKIEDANGVIVVATTEIHLPHRIGEALKSAFEGELELIIAG